MCVSCLRAAVPPLFRRVFACVNGGISGRRRNAEGMCDVMGVRVGRMYNMSMRAQILGISLSL